ncbi:MAG: hydroxyacid dehydrogenase [Verrucomicrobiae bacterium]|nr:hydroxyacid dehydrogenase [Verrucomicrobiae bacterium]
MKVLFNLPPSIIERCFRKSDLDRLAAEHEVRLPDFSAGGAFAEFAAKGERSDQASESAALKRFVQEHLTEAEAMVTGWEMIPVTAEDVAAAKNLRLIVHSAGSVKRLVAEEAWKRGIRVATCNEALAIGVAETTLGMILCGLKGIFPAREWSRAGHWHDPKLGTPRDVVRELYQVTIGVISASKVGLHLLRLLRAFEVEVLLYDPYVTPERAKELGATLVELDELVRRSTVVTLHAPSLPATRHLLKGGHFRAMQDGAIFINTARGAIVDETAMIEELKRGRITAFIDVTDPEPPAKDNPLRTLPNVILTPHLAGHVTNGCRRQGRSAVDQVFEFAANRPMRGEVTLEMLAQMG